MRSVTQTRQLAAADADGIALNQSTGGAADLVLNGAFVVNGVAQLGAQRQVELESLNNLSAATFTIEGTTDSGTVISESIAGPNAGVAATQGNFRTVTRISVDQAVADVEVGTNGVGASEWIPLDQYFAPFNVSLAVIIGTGTANVTAQYTFDDVFDPSGRPFVAFDHTDLTAVTMNDEAALVAPVKAVRLLTNSGTDPVRFEVAQGGGQ